MDELCPKEVHGSRTVPFRATEYPQLISFVNPARKIKPFQKRCTFSKRKAGYARTG